MNSHHASWPLGDRLHPETYRANAVVVIGVLEIFLEAGVRATMVRHCLFEQSRRYRTLKTLPQHPIVVQQPDLIGCHGPAHQTLGNIGPRDHSARCPAR